MSNVGTHADVFGSGALTRDDPFARQVREKVEAVLKGRKRLDQLVGATSVRSAVGLVLGKLEGATTLNEMQAWDYLDPENQELVMSMQELYRDRVRVWRVRQSQPMARQFR